MSNIHTGQKCDTGLWPQEMRYNLQLVTTPSTVWISRMGSASMPFLSTLSRVVCPPVTLAVSSGQLRQGQMTIDNPASRATKAWLVDLSDVLSIIRQRGLSGNKRKGGWSCQTGRWETKNMRTGKTESREMKSRQDTEGQEAGWKIGRCTTCWWNRARKTGREEWNSSSNNSQGTGRRKGDTLKGWKTN